MGGRLSEALAAKSGLDKGVQKGERRQCPVSPSTIRNTFAEQLIDRVREGWASNNRPSPALGALAKLNFPLVMTNELHLQPESKPSPDCTPDATAQRPSFPGERSRLAVVKKPLYLALKDMWLQLGAQQGMVRDVAQEGKGSLNQRRQARGRGTTSNKRDSERNGDLAPGDSPLNTYRPASRRRKGHGHGLG